MSEGRRLVLERAFALAFDAYSAPRDRYADDDAYIVKLRTDITQCFSLLQKLVHGEKLESFVVKHYEGSERPIVKGNGFDGLEIGEDREETEAFVKWINERMI